MLGEYKLPGAIDCCAVLPQAQPSVIRLVAHVQDKCADKSVMRFCLSLSQLGKIMRTAPPLLASAMGTGVRPSFAGDFVALTLTLLGVPPFHQNLRTPLADVLEVRCKQRTRTAKPVHLAPRRG